MGHGRCLCGRGRGLGQQGSPALRRPRVGRPAASVGAVAAATACALPGRQRQHPPSRRLAVGRAYLGPPGRRPPARCAHPWV
eukprot:15480927-Alexandrium_andersonii.AAC.1